MPFPDPVIFTGGGSTEATETRSISPTSGTNTPITQKYKKPELLFSFKPERIGDTISFVNNAKGTEEGGTCVT